MADEMNGERITDEMVHAALKAKNPTLYRDHLRHPANGPVLNASTEKEIQITRKMLAAALGASLAANAPAATAADGKWYMLSRNGMATLCADRDDAMTEAASADKLYPNGAPHRALQLVAANAGGEPVATIKSWTNGSYWRNYNVVFHRNDLPIGTDLYTHTSPPEGMAGWKLVPIEPTPAMLAAVVTSMDDFLLGKEAEKQYREDWAAMLDAAPHLPASEAKDLT